MEGLPQGSFTGLVAVNEVVGVNAEFFGDLLDRREVGLVLVALNAP